MADQSGVEWANLLDYDPVKIALGECCGHFVSHLITRTNNGLQYVHCKTCGPCSKAPTR